MPSLIDIANAGRIALGQRPFSFVDYNAQPALLLLRGTVREVLRIYPWTEAIKRASLPALAATDTAPWARAFAMPADCLVVHRVGDGEAFQTEGRRILTDVVAPAAIIYTSDMLTRNDGNPVGDGDDLPLSPLLVQAMALRFAMLVTESATGTTSLVQLIGQRAQAALIEARGADALVRGVDRPA